MATRKKTSSGAKTKKQRMQEIERAEAFRLEIILWFIVAFSLLLFISNLGIGGTIGGFVSSFLFGLFGLLAYVFPVFLLGGTFFAVSNRGNSFAIIKLIATIIFTVFLCVFFSLVAYGSEVVTPVKAFIECSESKSSGGLIGGTLTYFLVPAFGLAGSYIIDIVVLIIALVLITGKSAMKGMRNGSKKVYHSAKANNEKYQEYRQYKAKERTSRRMDNKVTGVSIDTDLSLTEKKKVKTNEVDELHELHGDDSFVLPEIKDEKKTKLSSLASESEVKVPLNDVASFDVTPIETDEYPNSEIVKSEESVFENNAYDDEPEVTDNFLEKFSSSLEEKFVEPDIVDTYPDEIDADPVMTTKVEIEPEPDIGTSSYDTKVADKPIIDEPVVTEKVKRKTRSSEEERQKGVEEVSSEINMEAAPVCYRYPTVDLLKRGSGPSNGNTKSQLMETAAKLQETLKNFGVDAEVTDYSCGPAVTRYEIQPKMGVKVSKIVNLADDIKLNLAAADIRIEAPIPGKAAVGIEVPNKQNVMVSFRELVESEEFMNSSSNISFAVGKDIGGKVKVNDIAKMPHLLIAGSTGSGKSVCINTIIMSILYKAKPDEVKLIMIDPKVVELSVYNGIPHLLIPVVTDPKKAAGALNWAVAEMTDRYQKFADSNVRDIKGYNAKVDTIEVPEGQERPEKMPQIVIIVDELADLMMVASKDVEEAICRLAQLARAAGIHLIIATQRPSVNVITGLIKANMPSRIAFAVSSGVDSRTILDMNGAEKLLGKGDMLFAPQGAPKPMRVQGAFVSDEEVQNVVEFIMSNNEKAAYSSDMQEKVDNMQTSSNTVSISDPDSADDGRDSYFNEAAKIIVDKEKASIGMLQRYLKIGFNRAARIMDQLEEAGIVGPEEGTKPRKVLMNQEEFQTFVDECL